MLRVFLSLAAFPAAALAAAQPPRYNVVIVAVDGLRADHLPFYGYSRPTAPHLNARSASAIIFDHAVAQASWTLPSFATLFTSIDPMHHGANSLYTAIPAKYRRLPELLRSNGWHTAGFEGGPFLDPVYGFERGFDLYRGCGFSNYRFFAETANQAADWIRANGDKPFFVFAHGNDLHPPFDLPHHGEKMSNEFDPDYAGRVDRTLVDYRFVALFNMRNNKRSPSNIRAMVPDEEYMANLDAIRSSSRDIADIAAHYDSRIHEADNAIEKIFEVLKETGHEKDTIVVLLGDHGLELGEKKVLGTGWHLSQFESIVHVPLVIWHPGLAARRVAQAVGLIDVAPTLFEFLGLPPEPQFEGKSLAALAAGSDRSRDTRYAFSSSSLTDAPGDRIGMYSAQDGRWKLIYSLDPIDLQLYDLQADPNETTNLAKSRPKEFARLKNTLSRHLGISLQ
jgi:arylsulfatase A-like enzyme